MVLANERAHMACFRAFRYIGQGVVNIEPRLNDPHLVPGSLAVEESEGPATRRPIEPSPNTFEREVFGGFRPCLP